MLFCIVVANDVFLSNPSQATLKRMLLQIKSRKKLLVAFVKRKETLLRQKVRRVSISEQCLTVGVPKDHVTGPSLT